MDAFIGFVFVVAFVIAVLWLYIILPMQMAEERNRSQLGWVLVSLFFSPFAAIILLWLMGDAEEGL